MAAVIGLDLGNFNSYVSTVTDMIIKDNRLGGNIKDLVSSNESFGIPSVFFYDGKGSFLAGRAAMTGAAKPECNRVRYLKRSLGKPLEIDGKPVVVDGKVWTYDDAIREVAQSVLREANNELRNTCGEQTNLVSLAYPATYSCAQREQLIENVQSAKTIDGTPFQVVGTIMEPAAAGLDFLSQIKQMKNTTVLVFDLGGGTFDLSLVSCYPLGRQRVDGSTYYYDILLSDGLPETGGYEFDTVICQLLRVKLERVLRENGLKLTDYLEKQLRLNAEKVKKELSDPPFRTVYEAYVPAMEDNVDLEITREEFEKAPQVVKMLSQMTGKARDILQSPGLPRPEVIVLTGGSCRMPMIREALAKAFPDYAQSIDSIRKYKPATAVSYGAARFGIPEIDFDPPVVKRLAYDLGIRYRSGDGFIIVTHLKCGTELPCSSDWTGGWLPEDSDSINYCLFEANTRTPEENNPDRDYRFIKSVTVQLGKIMPAETRTEARLVVDKFGLVRMEARKDENSLLFHEETKLEKLG